jgi:hypothetical protein
VKSTFTEHPGVIRGHTHLADGAEASIVGSLAALRPGDQVMATYRCHGYPARLGGRGHRRGGRRSGLRVPQGAGQAGHRAGRHRALQPADGGVPAARRGEDRGSGARGGPVSEAGEAESLPWPYRRIATEEAFCVPEVYEALRGWAATADPTEGRSTTATPSGSSASRTAGSRPERAKGRGAAWTEERGTSGAAPAATGGQTGEAAQ